MSDQNKGGMKLPGQITCLVSHPIPPKLTLWEWLGIKKRPPVMPQRLYAAVGSTIFISSAWINNEKVEI